jgi:hypothetical protein
MIIWEKLLKLVVFFYTAVIFAATGIVIFDLNYLE